jgi:ABC-type enterochelin transport system substrate-binding protein
MNTTMRSLFRGRRRLAPVALAATAVLSIGAVTACSSDDDSSSSDGDTKTVQDAHGDVEIPAHPQRVAAFDNRIFSVLEDWDIDLVSAPVSIIPDSITKYHDDKDIKDVGNFKDPDLEQLVASKPDLVITGLPSLQLLREDEGTTPRRPGAGTSASTRTSTTRTRTPRRPSPPRRPSRTSPP